MTEQQNSRSELLQRLVHQLQEEAHIKELPFTSNKPGVGRLIVLVREKWNSVSTRWYVRPMLHQQNRFNRTVARSIKELFDAQSAMARQILARLDELDQRVIHGDKDITLVARTTAEEAVRLRQLRKKAMEESEELARRLAEIEERLGALNL